jgi:1,4-dihydroxy-2-naphthoate octaprenyltransferase
METIIRLIKLARPHFLLGGILLYALGGGIAYYLGVPINWEVFLLGQAWGTLLQLSAQFLNEYFDAPSDADNANRTPFTGGSGEIGPGKLPRAAALWGAAGALAVVASLTVILVQRADLNAAAVLYMLLLFLGAVFYAVPPVRLEASGYGELTTSILVAHLVPGFAYLLQSGEMHQLVLLATFPLVFIHMAMLLAFSLPDFFNDTKHGKRTLLVRAGWQAGMRIHNLMILGAFFFLGLSILMGLPWRIGAWAFLPLPLGLLQIWTMNRIALGAKPNWTALTLSAVVLFVSMSYLLAWSFWTR